jgi:hypothetical protein
MDEHKILDVRPKEPYILEVVFAHEISARIDVEKELFGRVFEPLRDPAVFSEGRFDVEAGTIVWPNGADFSPEFLTEAAMAASS